MVLARNQSFRGLVLRLQDYHDNDQLAYLLTDRYGLVTFLMRGIKKPNAKQRYLVLPFTYGHYQGTFNDHGFSYLSTAQELQQFENVAQDIFKNAYVTYIYDLTIRAFTSQSLSTAWFEQILWATKLIDAGQDPEIICNILEVQLLQPFGVQPNWQRCVVGGENQGPFDYSVVYSGILCQKHWPQDKHRLHLKPKVVAYLRLFAQLRLRRIKHIAVDESTKAQLRHTLDIIYQDTVSVYPKSKKFIDSMYRWQI
ncbi:DNA repair protein RecO [Bombilactobacillus mellifer]|uniref:DNA repair protein RecO n=1 Tax=Bombilactobacillus mellifer TaxID=1218492 RepID=A0A0F4LTQ5_9LACO|nr:DNA repair protein RecO [Bombilactobacillus mellifer]KJY61748.1 DNA repair protein RecO [Bombilactobacillus mellifer]